MTLFGKGQASTARILSTGHVIASAVMAEIGGGGVAPDLMGVLEEAATQTADLPCSSVETAPALALDTTPVLTWSPHRPYLMMYRNRLLELGLLRGCPCRGPKR